MDSFTIKSNAGATLRRLDGGDCDNAYFERAPQPLLILAANASIEQVNAAARALLCQSHCLSIAFGRLTGFRGAASERFDTAWAQVRVGHVVHVVVTLHVIGVPQLWHVAFAALDADADAEDDDGAHRVITSIAPPVRAERGVLALSRLFGLTCAESRVLAHLTDDRTPSEIANELGVSLTTVRSHLQAMFQKTGARRQPELVKLALLAAAR